MEWDDRGFFLGGRPLGENASLVKFFTYDHGLVVGVCKVTKTLSALPLGAKTHIQGFMRTENQLSSLTLESLSSGPLTAILFKSPQVLKIVNSIASLISGILPERHPYRELYEETDRFMNDIILGQDVQDQLLERYCRWEVQFLGHIGYGLDLTQCAVTEGVEGLKYVSPKTGRAVCQSIGEPYHDKLFLLPAFLREEGAASPIDLQNALSLTGYFLEKCFRETQSKGLPKGRLLLQSSLTPH